MKSLRSCCVLGVLVAGLLAASSTYASSDSSEPTATTTSTATAVYHPSLGTVLLANPEPMKATIYQRSAVLISRLSVVVPGGGVTTIALPNMTSVGSDADVETEERSLQVHVERPEPTSAPSRASADGGTTPVVVEQVRWVSLPDLRQQSLLEKVREEESQLTQQLSLVNANLTYLKLQLHSIKGQVRDISDAVAEQFHQGVNESTAEYMQRLVAYQAASTRGGRGAASAVLDMLHEEELALIVASDKLSATKASVEAQIAALRKKNVLSDVVERYALVQLAVSMPTQTHVTLTITRIVDAVVWEPTYELFVEKSAVKLLYSAEVRQFTKMPWAKVQVQLSTGKPVGVGGAAVERAPALNQWELRSRDRNAGGGILDGLFGGGVAFEVAGAAPLKRQAHAARHKVHRRGAVPAADEARKDQDYSIEQKIEQPTALEVPEPDIISAGISDTFALATRHGIPARGMPVRLNIATIPMSCSRVYTAVPSRTSTVFAKLELLNKGKMTILPGAVLVYLEGTFVTATSLPLIGAEKGTATLHIGTEPRVTVSRRLVGVGKEEEKHMFTKNRRHTTVHYVSTIRSNAPFPFLITLKDIVPTSSSKDIDVWLREPKMAEGKDTSVRTARNADNGGGGGAEAEGAKNASPKYNFPVGSNVTLSKTGELHVIRHVPSYGEVDVPFKFTVETNEDEDIGSLV